MRLSGPAPTTPPAELTTAPRLWLNRRRHVATTNIRSRGGEDHVVQHLPRDVMLGQGVTSCDVVRKSGVGTTAKYYQQDHLLFVLSPTPGNSLYKLFMLLMK